jgi:FAD/FMN-containing dehydrogenase
MSVIATAHGLDALRTRMRGEVLEAGDPGWDAARQTFDLNVDQRPAFVAVPADEADVARIVDYARDHDLQIAAQSTGHNAGPLGSLDDVILVRSSRLAGVSIDAAARQVRVGTAARWRDVVPQLSELGLAALHGSSPDVGIAGYSLGGGMGWLARKHGLQTNSVTAFELVSADGRFVRTDAEHEPELFWALRGGGGNFGVVTAVEFAVYPVGRLYAGALFFPFEQASEVLHSWRELLPAAPEELMTWANLLQFPDLPIVPEPMRGASFAIVIGAFLGDERDGRELLASLRGLGPTMDTFAVVPPVSLANLAMDPPEPLPFVTGHRLLEGPSAAVIDGLVAAAGPGSGSQLAMLQLRHQGGALARTLPGAGARTTMPGDVTLFAGGVGVQGVSSEGIEATLAAVDEAARGSHAGYYPNFVEEPADASAFFDRETWTRLRQVKTLYDPDDLFRGNHHIPPLD